MSKMFFAMFYVPEFLKGIQHPESDKSKNEMKHEAGHRCLLTHKQALWVGAAAVGHWPGLQGPASLLRHSVGSPHPPEGASCKNQDVLGVREFT